MLELNLSYVVSVEAGNGWCVVLVQDGGNLCHEDGCESETRCLYTIL